MVFGSPHQRSTTGGSSVAEATARFEQGLSDVSSQAMERGVTILVEALPRSQSNVVNTLEEAEAIVRTVASPAVRTMFDTHNAEDETDPHAAVVDRYFEDIRHVHVNEMDGRHPRDGLVRFRCSASNARPAASMEAGYRSKYLIFRPARKRSRASPLLISNLLRSKYRNEEIRGYRRSRFYRFCTGARPARARRRARRGDRQPTYGQSAQPGRRWTGLYALHQVDIRSYDDIAPVLEGADTVYHLAAIPSVPESIDQPVPSHEVNIDGTFNVMRAAAAGGVRKLVYAASSSAYGDTPVLPKVETMSPNPRSPYAAQKLMGEYYCGVFSTCFGLDATSLRFFNVYGPRQDPDSPYSGVLSVFMKCLLERRSPTIHGDGEQTRDFTYVEDVVGLLMKTSKAPNVAGKVFNAGNGNRYSLNQIWKVLQGFEGVEIPALYGPARAGDVRDSQADTTAAVRELGHAPQFSIEEGLRRTLEWYRSEIAATVA